MREKYQSLALSDLREIAKFPMLEPDKEYEMIQSLASEDDADAKAVLIEHNLRLVVYIAKSLNRPA